MELLQSTDYSNIFYVDCFEKEFQKITREDFTDKEPYPRYQKWLIGKLAVLNTFGTDALKLRDFEPLNTPNGAPKLYSIRYPKSKLNPRVIYVYYDRSTAILLGAFLEKNSSDYSRNITKALGRLKILNQ